MKLCHLSLLEVSKDFLMVVCERADEAGWNAAETTMIEPPGVWSEVLADYLGTLGTLVAGL